MWMDGLIAKLAEAQHGVVARRQLLEIGVTPKAIRVRIERERLHPLHLGVYAVGHRYLTQSGRWMAAVLAVQGSVLSHRSAAALWRFLDEYGAVEVSSSRNARLRDDIRVRRVPSLIAGHCTVENGIPCTTVARTLLDLAATARTQTVRKAVKEAEFRRLFDLRAVEGVAAEVPRHRGRKPLRAALDGLSIGTVATNLELEERFLELVIGAGLPRPEVNAVVVLEDGTIYSVDFLWRDSRLAVETDGFDAHVRESSFYADSRRDLRLRSAGFEVLRFTWPDVSERAAEVVAAVRARL
jgi:hypothetical protein